MLVTPVDPRDVQRELEARAWRVYFWGRADAVEGGSEEFRVTEVGDVRRVVAWAEGRAFGRSFCVYVEVTVERALTLIAVCNTAGDRGSANR